MEIENPPALLYPDVPSLAKREVYLMQEASSFIMDDISRQLEKLGIKASITCTMPRSKVTVTFKSKEDMNLYKVTGNYCESDYVRFVVDI